MHEQCNMGAFLNTDIRLFTNVTETGQQKHLNGFFFYAAMYYSTFSSFVSCSLAYKMFKDYFRTRNAMLENEMKPKCIFGYRANWHYEVYQAPVAMNCLILIVFVL